MSCWSPHFSLATSVFAENAAASASGAIELIRDPHFQLGFTVNEPKPGKKVPRGVLQWDAAPGEPIWSLAQWTSKFSIAGAKAEKLSSGAVRFANEAKTIIVGPPGSEDADLVLGIDSRPEWNGHARQKGQPWPHLLVEQRLLDCPPLAELTALLFSMDARLRVGERFEAEGYNRNLHACHYLIHFTVQNLNKQSPGYGDFLWLGIPVYDDRDRMPRRFVAGDAASGKLIYCPAADEYTSESLQDGKWVAFQRDMLPVALDALKAAWEKGFLKGSQNLADYRFGGLNIGWEATGINRAEVQIHDLSLKAVRK
ncbi:MAG: hypothetical protein NTW86_16610 [Candidatus Sumerlaeota bacterium]|nr:hypothetical protein [Candidatus Sumerlaeota bacterium]